MLIDCENYKICCHRPYFWHSYSETYQRAITQHVAASLMEVMEEKYVSIYFRISNQLKLKQSFQKVIFSVFHLLLHGFFSVTLASAEAPARNRSALPRRQP